MKSSLMIGVCACKASVHPSNTSWYPTDFLFLNYGLGTCNVLLVIKHPWTMNNPTIGCTSNIVSANHTPPGIASWIQPFEIHQAMRPSSANEVGMGVPSKYCALPVASFGITCAVTLKRASLVRPQRTKKARQRWSSGVRIPIANATTAGPTPNDICVSEKGQYRSFWSGARSTAL